MGTEEYREDFNIIDPFPANYNTYIIIKHSMLNNNYHLTERPNLLKNNRLVRYENITEIRSIYIQDNLKQVELVLR